MGFEIVVGEEDESGLVEVFALFRVPVRFVPRRVQVRLATPVLTLQFPFDFLLFITIPGNFMTKTEILALIPL